MEEFEILARSLITIGLAALLIMLRLDAERFGTAEYYEATRYGEQPRIRRRLAWYGLGFAIAIAILFIHPSPQRDLFLGSGDRLPAVLGGIAYGLIGILVAVSFATFRYHRIRFPDAWSYPGALLNYGRHGVHRRDGVPWRPAGPPVAGRGQPDARQLHAGDPVHADHAARRTGSRSLPARPDARDRASSAAG